MNKLDKQYTDLLQDILDNGVEKKDRTGTGTKSVFGRQIRHKMSDGFPLLTTKRMPFKTIVTELLWFLRGETNIKPLVDNNCHIWDGDAYKNYLIEDAKILPNMSKEKMTELGYGLTQEEFINKIKTDDEFAKKWGELGPIYGKQWRKWKQFIPYNVTEENCKVAVAITDQIQNLINDLKINPDSRRLMVNAWNVGELDQMVLPPCHYGFQVYTRELSLDERLCIADKFNPLIREDCLTKTHHHDETEELKLVYRHEFLDSLGPNVVPQRRAISLMWNQRSVDTFLGLPFNIASYGLLLEIIAKEVNMVPDELIGNLGDTHLYLNHLEQAREQIGRDLSYSERWNILKERNGSSLGLDHDRIEQEVNESTPARTREPFPLPTLELSGSWKFLSSSPCFADTIQSKDIELKDYQYHPEIKAALSN
jgi:thymidylate synthase